MWFEAWAKKKDGKEDRPKERRNNQKAFYACTFCMYLIAANHPGCIAWPGQARHGLTLTEPQNIKALCVISYGNRESGIIETMDNLLRQAFCSNTNDSLPQNDCRFVRPSTIQLSLSSSPLFSLCRKCRIFTPQAL